MNKLNASQDRASAHVDDSDASLPDGDTPSRRPLYRLHLESLHRYIASFTSLRLTPLPRLAFRPVPISANADAIQMTWVNWSEILSSISDSKPFLQGAS